MKSTKCFSPLLTAEVTAIQLLTLTPLVLAKNI